MKFRTLSFLAIGLAAFVGIAALVGQSYVCPDPSAHVRVADLACQRAAPALTPSDVPQPTVSAVAQRVSSPSATADDALIASLHQQVAELEAKLEAEKSAHDQSVTELRDIIARIRTENAVADFLRLPIAAELTEKQRDRVARIVAQIGMVPSDSRIKELAVASENFDKKFAEWNDRDSKLTFSLGGDFYHPEMVRLRDEREKFCADWEHELETILGSEVPAERLKSAF